MIPVNHSHLRLSSHIGTMVSQMNVCKQKTTATTATASRQEIPEAAEQNVVILFQSEAFAESTADRSHP